GFGGAANFEAPIPDGMDGSWSLHLEIGPTQNPAGTATVTLSNGRPFAFDLNGKYSPQTGVANLKLTGKGDIADPNRSVGSQLNVSISSFGDLFGVSGKLLGQ